MIQQQKRKRKRIFCLFPPTNFFKKQEIPLGKHGYEEDASNINRIAVLAPFFFSSESIVVRRTKEENHQVSSRRRKMMELPVRKHR